MGLVLTIILANAAAVGIDSDLLVSRGPGACLMWKSGVVVRIGDHVKDLLTESAARRTYRCLLAEGAGDS